MLALSISSSLAMPKAENLPMPLRPMIGRESGTGVASVRSLSRRSRPTIRYFFRRSLSDMPMPLSSMTISERSSIGVSGMAMRTSVAFASQALATSSPITGGKVAYICRPRCLMVAMSKSIRYGLDIAIS